MKLRYLQAGDFFQFKRQGTGFIFVACDPVGSYLSAGVFLHGVPHIHGVDGKGCPYGYTACLAWKCSEKKSAPERAVTRIHMSAEPQES